MAKDKDKAKEPETKKLVIKPPNIQTVTFELVGTSPLVQCAFGEKARKEMAEAQRQGSQQRKKERGKKAPKDFRALYLEALHVSTEGWFGHPASAFRQALVSACRTGGVTMSLAKLAVTIEADGIDRVSGMPLVRIEGEPEYFESAVRLKKVNTFDIRARPMFREWSCNLTVRYDADVFEMADVANLLLRAGLQCGIGEGRNDSKDSCGVGWGSFEFKAEAQAQKESA